MKKSKELLGLTVISIEDGKDLGQVSDFVINPSKGAVEFLIIDCGVKYLGLKVLPFGLVEGVGEYAVTVQSADALGELAEEADVKGLLEKDVHVIGTRVLTKKGKLIGTVSEFLVDDDDEGKISGCELDPGDNSEEKGIIPAEQIITFGKDILVVNEGVESLLVKPDTDSGTERTDVENPISSNEVSALEEKSTETVEQKSEPSDEVQPAEQTTVQDESTPTEPLEETANDSEEETEVEETEVEETEVKETGVEETENESQPSQAAMMFEQRQRKYLLGRKVTKRIESDKGELIAEEGQVVTDEMLDKAKQAGKFAELSMNTRP